MTREEAIRWLTNEKWKNANNKYKKEWNEAFGLAIEALSADAVPTVIRAKTFMRKEDFDKWAEDIKRQGENVICIPCDAEVVSAVQGEWIDSREYPWSKCNKCGYTITCYQEEEFRYCPNCGARMEASK